MRRNLKSEVDQSSATATLESRVQRYEPTEKCFADNETHNGLGDSFAGRVSGEMTFVTHDLIVLWHPHSQSESQQKLFLSNATQVLQRKSAGVRIINISSKKNAYLSEQFSETYDHLWPDYVSVSIEQLVSLVRKIQIMKIEGNTAKKMQMSVFFSPIVLYCQGDRGKIMLILLCLLESFVKFKDVESWTKKEIESIAKYVEPLHQKYMAPSHKTYWTYFRAIIWRQFVPMSRVLYLNFITLRGVPKFETQSGFQVYFKIYRIANLKLQYISGIFYISHSLASVSLKVSPNQPLAGDILIRCYLTRSKNKHEVTKSADELSSASPNSQELVFQTQFNASAIGCPITSFSKEELDRACDDARFPAESSVELVVSESQQFQSGDVDLGTVLPASVNLPMRTTESMRENSFVSTVEGESEVRSGSLQQLTKRSSVLLDDTVFEEDNQQVFSSVDPQQQQHKPVLPADWSDQNISTESTARVSVKESSPTGTTNAHNLSLDSAPCSQPPQNTTLDNSKLQTFNTVSSSVNPFNQSPPETSFLETGKFPNPDPTEADETIVTPEFSQGLQFQPGNLSSLRKKPKSDRRYALQLEDLELDLLADFEQPGTLRGKEHSKFPVPVKSGVKFRDERTANALNGHQTILVSESSLKPQKIKQSKSSISPSFKLTTNDVDFTDADPARLAVGTRIVPFTDRQHSSEAAKVSPIGQGATASPKVRKPLRKTLSKSQDNILASMLGSKVSSPAPATLNRDTSEHSSETQTPHSQDAFNLGYSFDFSSARVNQQTLSEEDLQSPAPKFPLEQVLNQIEIPDPSDLYEDHDYSFPNKKQKRLELPDQNKDSDSDMPQIRRYNSGNNPYSPQSQPTTPYSPWGFQIYENPNSVTSPVTPAFPMSTQQSQSQTQNRFVYNQGPMPFRGSQRQNSIGSNEFQSFNFSRNKQNQFSPGNDSLSSGSSTFSPVFQQTSHGNRNNPWSNQSLSTFDYNTQISGWPTFATRAAGDVHPVRDSSLPTKNVSGFDAHRKTTSRLQSTGGIAVPIKQIDQESQRMTTFGSGSTSAIKGSLTNGSSYSSTSVSPNQGSFKPNDWLQRQQQGNSTYNFKPIQPLDSIVNQLNDATSESIAAEIMTNPSLSASSSFLRENGDPPLAIDTIKDRKKEDPQKTELIKNESAAAPKSDRVNQLKADIKHQFLDAVPSRELLAALEKEITEEDRKSAEKYATLRRQKDKSLSFSTSVPDLGRHVSREKLNWKSTESLSGKPSGVFLRGNLDSLRNSMKNLLDGDKQEEPSTILRRPMKSTVAEGNKTGNEVERSKRESPSKQQAGLRPRAASENHRPKPDLNSEFEQPPTSDLRNVEEWIQQNPLKTSFSSIPSKSTDLPKTQDQKPRNEKSPLRNIGSLSSRHMWNFDTSSPANQMSSSQERPLSPSSVSTWYSGYSKQSNTLNSLRKDVAPNFGSLNRSAGMQNQNLSSASMFPAYLANTQQLGEAFRNPFSDVAKSNEYTKSIASNQSESDRLTSASMFNATGKPPNEVFKFASSAQDLNQMFNSRTPLSILKIGNGKTASVASAQDRELSPKSQPLPMAYQYGSLQRGATLNHNRLPKHDTAKERSKSFSSKEMMSQQQSRQVLEANRLLNSDNHSTAIKRSQSAHDKRSDSSTTAQDDFDKQFAELDSMCLELQKAVSSMAEGKEDASSQRSALSSFNVQQGTDSLNRFKPRSTLMSPGSHGRQGPPVASSAHFSRTMSPSRMSESDTSDIFPQRSLTLSEGHTESIGTGSRYNSLTRDSIERSRVHNRTYSHDSRLSSRNRSFDQLSSVESEGQYFNASDISSPSAPSWYRPSIGREDVISILKEKPSGSFLVRDSNTYPGSYALAIKVDHPPMGKESANAEELVRHYLVERNDKGLRVRGHQAEQYFDNLTSLIKEHALYPVSLPCRLRLPSETTPTSSSQQPNGRHSRATSTHRPPVAKRSSSLIRDSNTHLSMSNQSLTAPRYELDNLSIASSTCSLASAQNSAACLVLYVSFGSVENLSGDAALARAVVDPEAVVDPVILKIKVNPKGVTLTDTKRRLFFRKFIPIEHILFCSTDPLKRCLRVIHQLPDKSQQITEKKCFGLVVQSESGKENEAWMLAEYEQDQPVSAIVNFTYKTIVSTIPS